LSSPIDLPDAARMKVHLRVLPLAGRSYRVVTLRSSAGVRFSTNYYHDTWHVVSDAAGSQVLARLLWGLAYQKQAGTLVLIAGPHLVDTPFDGARSDPVVLVPSGLTPVCEEAFRQLKGRLGRPGPTRTIRWQTFGLDRELALREQDGRTDLQEQVRQDRDAVRGADQMSKVGGLICYTAPPLVLRDQAVWVARMRTARGDYSEMDYHFLADGERARNYADGEVQIFHDYRDRVSAARAARREVLSRPDAPTDPEALEIAISQQREVIKQGRRRRSSSGARRSGR
jgi:hypothetical protein